MDKTQKYTVDLDEIVPEYHSRNKYIRDLFFKRFKIALIYLKKINPIIIMDAGCGNGYFTNILKNWYNFQEVIGVDLNIHTEDLNNKYSSIKFIRADILSVKINKKFDAITCLDVLEHFENAEQVIVKLNSMLKNGGYLIVSGPVESFWYKLGRFFVKGSFSQETGPGAGKHYHNIVMISEIIKKHFELVEETKIRFLFIHLFNINLYKKIDKVIK